MTQLGISGNLYRGPKAGIVCFGSVVSMDLFLALLGLSSLICAS